jgi:hypothetical protein
VIGSVRVGVAGARTARARVRRRALRRSDHVFDDAGTPASRQPRPRFVGRRPLDPCHRGGDSIGGRDQFRVSFRYLMRFGISAASPRRFFRSAS